MDGIVEINTPEVDPTQGITNLPTALAIPEPLQGCQVGGREPTSRFINTGRGGLPTIPTEPLDSSDVMEDLQPPAEWQENLTDASDSSTMPNRIVEAQGWKIDERGKVVLVAEMDSAMAQVDGCRLNNTRSSSEAR